MHTDERNGEDAPTHGRKVSNPSEEGKILTQIK